MRAFTAQLSTELRLTLRRGENLVVTLVVPVVLLLFFGVVAPMGPGDAARPETLVPGILGLAVVSTSMVSLGIATAFERSYGVLKRLLGSPLPIASLLLAKTSATLIVEVAQVALVGTIAWQLLGWRPEGSWGLTLLVLFVGSVAFAGIGLLMAGTLRAEATLALANGLYLCLILLGGFVVPVDQLPPPLVAAASWLPSGALSNGLRGALSGTPGDALSHLGLLGAWALAAGVAAVATFKAD